MLKKKHFNFPLLLSVLILVVGVTTFLFLQTKDTPTEASSTVINSIDTTGDVGLNSSIAIDTSPGAPDNFPYISYFDQTNQDLKYIKCGDAACTPATNIVTTIEGQVVGSPAVAATQTGLHTSIVIGSDHFARISYYSITNNAPAANFSLRFVKCLNIECRSTTTSPAGIPTNSPVDLGTAENSPTSIALDNSGFPRITFSKSNGTGSGLNIIQCSSADCSTGKTPVELDGSAAVVGSASSIAVGSDNLTRVAYNDQTNTNLKFIKCATVTCTTSETKTVLDGATPATTVGYNPSMKLSTSNLPRISYFDVTTSNQHYKYAECTVDDCTGTVNITQLDPEIVTDSGGSISSLTLGTDGIPSIAYQSIQKLKFIRCSDTSCTSKNILFLDSTGNVGADNSIAFGADGFPRISYRDQTNADLKYIQCTDATCGRVPSAPTSLLMNVIENGALTQFNTTDSGRLALTSKELVVTAVNNDLDLADVVDKYEVQVATDNAFSSIVYDSGSTGTSMASRANGAQSAQIEVPAAISENTTYYWRIRFWDHAGNAGDFSPSGAGAASFKTSAGLTPVINNIDTTGDVGQYSSIVIYPTDGFARISYYDATNGDLKFKRCTNADCTTAVTTTVDSTGIIGQHTALALNSSGLARIVYYNATLGGPFGPVGDVKYVECLDADCSTGNRNITTIATSGDVGQFASIAISSVSDGELASISYYNTSGGFPSGPGDLIFVKCPNTACTGSSSVNLDTVGNTGSYTSLKLSTTAGTIDYPRISFYDTTNGNLRFVRCGDKTCTPASATFTNVDGVSPVTNVGQYTSLSLTSTDIPYISYYDVTNGDLKLVICGDVTCSSGNTFPVLDTTGDVGKYTSLSLTVTGIPRISYYDVTNTALKFATCSDTVCTSSTMTTLNKVGNMGQYSSLSLGADSFARVSYYDASNGDLKFALCTTGSCTAPTNTPPTTPTTLYANTAANTAQSGVASPATLNSTSVVFSAVHNDPDGDATDKYELQIDNNNDFSSLLYDSEQTGLVGTTLTSTSSGSRTPTPDISILANGANSGAVLNNFSGGVPTPNTVYYWRIRFWDINGARGDFSPDIGGAAQFTVIIGGAPTAPTALYANTSVIGAQSGRDNPTNLASTSVVFSAIHNDPDANAANKYELQIDDDNDFSSVIYDSGSLGTSMTSTTDGSRTHTPDIGILAAGGGVTNTLVGGVPSLNTTYFWRIKFWDTDSNVGAYSPSGVDAAYFIVSTTNCATPPTGLVSWWPGDNNSSDMQGTHPGILTGGTTFNSAKVAQGFSFDGVNDSVSMTDTGFPSGTQDRTLSAWIKTSATGEKYFLSYGTDVATQAFGFGVLNNKLTVTQSGSSISSSASVNSNVFHHVAVTYSATGDTYKLYIDGVQDGTGTMTTSTVLSGSLFLGRYVTATNFFAGIVDEPMIFNRALSLSEINSMYLMGSTGVCKPSLNVFNMADTLTRQAKTADSNHTLILTTPKGIPDSSTFTITFPAGFNLTTLTEDDIDIQDDGVDLTTAPDCTGSEKASVSISGQVITVTICNGDGGAIAPNSVVTVKIGTNATQSGTGSHTISNPSSVANYVISIGGTFGETGSLSLPIVDSDQVNESASITPYITFDLDTGISVGETPTPYTVYFGNLSPLVVSSSDHTSINSVYLDLNTNAVGGAIVTVKGAYGGLKSTMVNSLITTTDSGTAVPLSAGTEGFGLCIANTSTVGGTITKTAPYNGSCDATTHNIGGITISPRTLFTSSGAPVDGTDNNTAEVMFKTSISPTTKAAIDYTEVVTFIATGSF